MACRLHRWYTYVWYINKTSRWILFIRFRGKHGPRFRLQILQPCVSGVLKRRGNGFSWQSAGDDEQAEERLLKRFFINNTFSGYNIFTSNKITFLSALFVVESLSCLFSRRHRPRLNVIHDEEINWTEFLHCSLDPHLKQNLLECTCDSVIKIIIFKAPP